MSPVSVVINSSLGIETDNTIPLQEPITEILGGPNIFLEEGNNLNLTCVVRDSPEPPQYIFWYRNSQVGWQYTVSRSLYGFGFRSQACQFMSTKRCERIFGK